MRSLFLPGVFAFVVALPACSSSSSNSNSSTTASSGPCDPLAAPPTTLQNVIGVGKDGSGTLYVVDEPTGAYEPRIFISVGSKLQREYVDGSGQSGSMTDGSVTLSFSDPGADASTARNVAIAVSNGKATSMSFASSGKSNPGDPGETSLTLVDASNVASLTIVNLPNEIRYVADVSNGDVIVVTAPTLNDENGTPDERVFYGTTGAMIEHPLVSFEESDSGDANIAFSVGNETYTAHFTYVTNGTTGGPGPGTLDAGSSGNYAVTQRSPTPTTLTELAFTCTSS